MFELTGDAAELRTHAGHEVTDELMGGKIQVSKVAGRTGGRFSATVGADQHGTSIIRSA